MLLRGARWDIMINCLFKNTEKLGPLSPLLLDSHTLSSEA